MSVLNKVESGYLQLMRILVLALATIVLVGVVVLGVSAVSDYNAKPATVSEAIDIKASSFKLDDDAAEGTGDDAAKQHSPVKFAEQSKNAAHSADADHLSDCHHSGFLEYEFAGIHGVPPRSIVIVERYGGRVIFLFFAAAAEFLHGFQRLPETVDGTVKTNADADEQHPNAKVELLTQPNG